MGRRHRSPGAGEEQRPTSRQEEAGTVDELSRLVAEVQAAGDGLVARVITLAEHRTRVAELEVQGLAREWLWEAEDLEAFMAANDFLDALLDAPRAREWTRYDGTTNAPSGPEEAEALELGRRVALHRGYQVVLFDDPADYA
jgi:hypothetical protein